MDSMVSFQGELVIVQLHESDRILGGSIVGATGICPVPVVALVYLVTAATFHSLNQANFHLRSLQSCFIVVAVLAGII